MSATLAVTYVWHGDKAYCASTINRESSALEGGTYAETIVWTWDDKTRARGDMAWMGSCATGSIYTHQAVVERLFATGSPEEESNE